MTNFFNCICFRFLASSLFVFWFSAVKAQSDETLLTIDNEVVTSEEFLKLYNKNLDLVKDESQKDIDNYLDLFVNYKLKLKEAKRLGLDKDPKYKREFSNYKKQLTKNYIKDNEVTDALVKEAYDRIRYDIKASHILILDNEENEDTLVIYNKLLDYRKTLKEEGFEASKAKYHDGKTVLVEDLGYFSAFKMVYDFESKAYTTEPGEVSMPFKTQFGYHIVRVDEKRPSLGKLTVAHIMVALEQKDSTINPSVRINDIYKKLQQGESFEALAKQFSDDKSSARNGGKLRTFKSGQLSSVDFENAAFSIDSIGEITEPIKTEYGWHIIKLLKKEPIQDFETLKPTLEAQVQRDQRSKLINSAMANKLSKRYDISKNSRTKSYFRPILEGAYFSGKFNLPEDYDGKISVITINDSIFTNNDFLQFLKSKQRQYMRKKTSIKKVLDTELPLFYEQSILNYRESNLVNENQEFSDILTEYRDGLLLFALMEKEVWNMATKDSLGLSLYYEANASDYRWDDRIDATVATSSEPEVIDKVLQFWEQGKTTTFIKERLNSDTTTNVLFSTGEFEKSNSRLPVDLKFTEGLSKVYFHNGNYHAFNITSVIPSSIKSLKEARGSVINDYQNYLENEWIKKLRKQYTVNVNTDMLNQLKSKIQN